MGEGQYGELVITTINKEEIPLFRFRTRDICSLAYQNVYCQLFVKAIETSLNVKPLINFVNHIDLTDTSGKIVSPLDKRK